MATKANPMTGSNGMTDKKKIALLKAELRLFRKALIDYIRRESNKLEDILNGKIKK